MNDRSFFLKLIIVLVGFASGVIFALTIDPMAFLFHSANNINPHGGLITLIPTTLLLFSLYKANADKGIIGVCSALLALFSGLMILAIPIFGIILLIASALTLLYNDKIP
jgi:hypothetical protein